MKVRVECVKCETELAFTVSLHPAGGSVECLKWCDCDLTGDEVYAMEQKAVEVAGD
jgi:hypothetical protein